MGNSFSNKYEIPHECQLEQQPDTLQQYFKGRSKLCKWFRKMCVVSSNKSHGRIYIKSKYFIEVDRRTHLDSLNYYIIHPFSQLRYYWEIFIIIFLFFWLNIVPYCIIVNLSKQHYAQITLMIMTVVCTLDMVLNFFTGYFERSTKYIVLNPILIAKKYVLNRFLLDFISTFPLDFILYSLRFHHFYVRLASLIKMLRIYSYLMYLEEIRKKKQYSLYKFRCVGILSVLIFGTNIIACVIGLAIVADKGINTYGKSFDYIYLVFTAIGFVFSLGDQQIILVGYRFFVQFVAIAFGMVIRNIVIVQIMILFKLRNVSQRKYKQLLRELHEYMKFKTLPQRTRERVLNYYKFMFKNMYFNEKEIKEQISEYLMEEVRRNIFVLWFKIEAFKDCPKEFVEMVISNLQRDIYLDGDVIIQENDDADAMYFIKHGTVAIYIGDGKNEILHLEENHFFGDRTLLHEQLTYGITVIAVESTEVFKLTKKVYFATLEQFPGLYTEMYPTLIKRKDIFENVTSVESLDALRKSAEAYFHI